MVKSKRADSFLLLLLDFTKGHYVVLGLTSAGLWLRLKAKGIKVKKLKALGKGPLLVTGFRFLSGYSLPEGWLSYSDSSPAFQTTK